MARPKEFDRDEVLEKALAVFWERGYEATSMQDLVDRMGIGRASLYDTFKSKHALFSEALDRYAERMEESRIAPLRRHGSPTVILKSLFQSVARDYVSGRTPTCLALKSALTTCREDRETAARVAQLTERFEEAFLDLLARAREEGEIDGNRDLRALARFLTHSFQGLTLTASIRRNRRVLSDVIGATLSVLD